MIKIVELIGSAGVNLIIAIIFLIKFSKWNQYENELVNENILEESAEEIEEQIKYFDKKRKFYSCLCNLFIFISFVLIAIAALMFYKMTE